MNQKIGLVILPAPKQDGSGHEYMIPGAGMSLNVLIRDMFVLYFQKSSKQQSNKGRLSCISFFHLFLLILKHVDSISVVYVQKRVQKVQGGTANG